MKKNLPFISFYFKQWQLLSLALLLVSMAANAQLGVKFGKKNAKYVSLTPTNSQRLGAGIADDSVYLRVPIGFTFKYNKQPHNYVAVSCNGYIALDTTVTVRTSGIGLDYVSIATSNGNAFVGATRKNIIAAMNADLVGSTGKSDLRYGTTGNAPNRVFVVEWKKYNRYNTGNKLDTLNFQIRLREDSNIVELRYGKIQAPSSFRAQVGVQGAVKTAFNIRGGDNWQISTAGAADSVRMLTGLGNFPTDSLVYTFSPSKVYDAQAVGLLISNNSGCVGSSVGSSIIVKNVGIDTITNITVVRNVTGAATATTSGTYAVILPQGVSDTIALGTNVFGSSVGIFKVEAIISVNADINAANDTTRNAFQLSSPATAATTLGSSDSVCSGSVAILRAQGAAVSWFSDSLLTTKIGSADSIISGPITTSTKFFAANYAPLKGFAGKRNKAANATAATTNRLGLLLKSTNVTVIDSVHIYPTTAATINVQLQDSLGKVLTRDSLAITVSMFGTKVGIPLTSYKMLPGKTYRLVAYKSGLALTPILPSMAREVLTAAAFPITNASGTSVTGGVTVSAAGVGTRSNTYNYFYDIITTNYRGCATVVSKTVKIGNVPPVVNFTYIVTGRTVKFTNTNGALGTSKWTFGQGNAGSTLSSPTFSYKGGGIYTVRLLVTTPCGTDSSTQQVIVPYSVNVRAIAASYTRPFSCEATVSTAPVKVAIRQILTDTVTNVAVTVNVAGPVNSTTTANYAVALAGTKIDTLNLGALSQTTAGSYVITIIVKALGDAVATNDTTKTTFTINATPAKPTVTGPNVVCAGSQAVLYGPSGTKWYADSAATQLLANGDTLIVNPITATSTYYNVIGGSVVDTVGKFAKAATTTASIAPFNTFGLRFDALDNIIINGVYVYPDITFTPTSSGSWVRLSLVNSALAVMATDSIDATGTVSGNKLYMPLNFNVPVGTGYRLMVTGVKAGQTAKLFRDASGGTSGISYPYTIASKVTITGGQTSNTGASTNYYFAYNWKITSVGCSAFTAKKVLTGTVAATSNFSYVTNGNTVTFTNLSQSGSIYTWNFGDGSPTSNAVNPVHTYTGSLTTYNVTLTASNTCPTTPNVFGMPISIVTTGLANAIPESSVSIYPNPTTSTVTVTTAGNFNISRISIYSLTGVLMHTENVLATSNTTILNIASFPAGTYLVKCSDKAGNETVKRLVKN